ncbi:MAG: hypothetical protein ACLFQE_02785 [Thermotogota bacterium]
MVEKQQTIVKLIEQLKSSVDTVQQSGVEMHNSSNILSKEINKFKINENEDI